MNDLRQYFEPQIPENHNPSERFMAFYIVNHEFHDRVVLQIKNIIYPEFEELLNHQFVGVYPGTMLPEFKRIEQ